MKKKLFPQLLWGLLLTAIWLSVALPTTTEAQISSNTAFRIRRGTATPATCNQSDVFFVTGSNTGYICGPNDTWVVFATASTALSGSGTANTLSKWTAGTVLGNATGLTSDANGRLTLGIASSLTGALNLAVSGDANFTTIQAADSPASDVTIKLPADDPAASDVLTVTSFSGGVATLEWAPVAAGMSIGGAVTGGTEGSIPFIATGPVLAQNNANLFWDNSNTRLGIGTTTPDHRLDVESASGSASIRVNSPSATQISRVYVGGSARSFSMAMAGASVGSNMANHFMIVDENNGVVSGIRMAIDSSGRVAINPQSNIGTQSGTLDIFGHSTGAQALAVRGADGSTVPVAYLRLRASNNATINTHTQFEGFSSVAAASGYGSQFLLTLRDTSLNAQNAATFQWRWTNHNNANRSSAVGVQIVDNAQALRRVWEVSGNGSNTGTVETLTGPNGATTLTGTVTENITLNTGGDTTDSTIDLPANSFILSVTARVTTTIADVDSTTIQLGDPTTATRFNSTASALTAGTTIVGLNQLQGAISTDAAGPVQLSTAKVRITLAGGADNTPSAGAVRITIHYITLGAPTS
jgi:hypothetical protein